MLTDIAVISCCAVMLVPALLCNSIDVMKCHLTRPVSYYYAICCLLAWASMLVWRGHAEGWLRCFKILMLGLLSMSILLIDTLPVDAQPAFRRVGLPTVVVISVATWIWLKCNMNEMYSKYDPFELRNLAGFISFSSFARCTTFLSFQVRINVCIQ